MQKHYTIRELAQMYQLPKSKIRFWEKAGLLKPTRDTLNDYRLYDVKDIIDIGDIVTFREMGVSIKQLQNFRTATYQELTDMIQETKQDVEGQIIQLNQAKQALDLRLKKMDKLRDLEIDSYRREVPPFNYLSHFSSDPLDSTQLFLENPYGYSLVATLNSEIRFHEAFVRTDKRDGFESIWTKPTSACYTALLRFNADCNDDNNLNDHISYFNQQGIEIWQVVATYLSTFVDGKRYDYYQGWFFETEK